MPRQATFFVSSLSFGNTTRFHHLSEKGTRKLMRERQDYVVAHDVLKGVHLFESLQTRFFETTILQTSPLREYVITQLDGQD